MNLYPLRAAGWRARGCVGRVLSVSLLLILAALLLLAEFCADCFGDPNKDACPHLIRMILNSVPAVELPQDVLHAVDILTPNEFEVIALTRNIHLHLALCPVLLLTCILKRVLELWL